MRQMIVGVLMLFGILAFATGTPATNGTHVAPIRQWAIVNFDRTTQVAGYALNAGQYLIVHDFDKMDRGEPCTSIYTFGESGAGPQKEAVAFHCIPRDRALADHTTVAMDTVAGDTGGCTLSWGWNMDRMTEFQFAGDTEGHGVPEDANAPPVPHEHQGH